MSGEYIDEKEAGPVQNDAVLQQQLKKKDALMKKFYLPFFIMGIITLWYRGVFQMNCHNNNHEFNELVDNHNDISITPNSNFEKDYTKTFEIQLPIIYDDLIHQQTILNHSFGNSWGVPAKTSFKPDIDSSKFNRVVLNLETWVDGVQYDRLAHVFIDDIPVWRTSTVEPGNSLVYSESSKDVSKYLSLFQKDEIDVTFQLDNLVRGNLNGAFNTTLSILYYYQKEHIDLTDPASYFQISNRPAQRISKIHNVKPNKTPLLYYPSDKLDFTIPIINSNTTNLKLNLYTSGNAAEEFWYSNVLDQYKNKFSNHGHSLLGHGPVRVVNVYLDGIKISSTAPEPIIFSGGISPSLWKPIIGVNAFDIKPLEIDLTSFLPNLWENGGKLEIEITNGEELGKVAQNWITAVDLLHWESSEIESSFGEVERFDNSSSYKAFAIGTSPSNLFQTVVSKHSSEIFSNLTFNLFNGTQLPIKLHTISDASFTNFQAYSNYGDSQLVTSVTSNGFKSEIIKDDEVIAKLTKSKVFPLYITLLTEPVINYDISYDVNITHAYQNDIKIDDQRVYHVKSVQNGTSSFTLSPKGNHGFGSTEQNYTAHLKEPFPKVHVKDHVIAINGSLVNTSESDFNNQALESIESVDASEFQMIVQEIQRLVKNDELSSDLAQYLLRSLKTHQETMESRKNVVRESINGFDGPLPNIGSRH
ncbi:Peptide-N4-(N-acetyl-beta-glucosaminyl)asparagineamidase A [Wickerhamomyces ciferrii]|uniref:Peptide-N4-(N-acetyl-beta-glucosaminyl)asparagine amidase A n=1 Tax=Wickerhamomyces ciferrii (strain ATCC 14091 / BCRC 22168 / CBS 111 / JCM 3599 / NBRC 0793 / NRRL Y-1031 F-60-10) TaxID=1206466 RepID=K0KLJ5_WICCF|nr:Peptide-N4-(N-acetyl-beta-glucosaminyl)asparagineamidase A [Wickerhamomyces ciferrii]CCH43087.1 Peptide-N4-(N-acetyl-beta-glucosaminyl)asparagineamidase A [Wickerhamomyces ciferrii]